MKKILPLLNSTINHQPTIILVEPQISKNIGSVARAMYNFGLKDLRLVNPSKDWFNKDVIRLSSGAFTLLKQIKIFKTVKDALHDIHINFATTARTRNMYKTSYTPQKAIHIALSLLKSQNKKVSFLFGREKSGLNNDDTSLVNGIIHIPINPKFSSLNLAQAVVVISYEWIRQLKIFIQEKNQKCVFLEKTRIATTKETTNFFNHLENKLEESKFFKVPGKQEIMKINIRNLFLKANLTEQDIRILHGVVSSLVNINLKKNIKKSSIKLKKFDK